MTLRLFAIICLFLTIGTSRLLAATLGDAVPGGHGLTYFDLMRRVVPDLKRTQDGAAGTAIVPFRHIDGKDLKADPDSISLKGVDEIAIPGDGTRIVLSFDFGAAEGSLAGAKFLALFSLAPSVRLLDLVEIGGDRFVDVSLGKPPPPAPDTPLILVESWHDNSNQSYGLTDMIFVREGRFHLIDTVPTFGDAFCAYRRTQAARMRVVPGNGPYRAIEATVREEVTLTHEDCGDEKPPAAGTTTYRATYRWNARRQTFTTTSHDLDRLAAINRKRM